MKRKILIIWGVIFWVLILNLSCTHKVMRSEETPSTILREEAQKSPRVEPPQTTTTTTPSASPLPETEKRAIERPLKEETLISQPASPPLPKEELKKEKEAQVIAAAARELKSIFFDFDQAVIREDQKEIMLQNAQWLKAHPQIRVRIEGNCDERGTAEYNLALGQKRAEAAKEFLVGLGISPQRMQTISYGFERPLDPGHNEEAWAKNRRVDFTILK